VASAAAPAKSDWPTALGSGGVGQGALRQHLETILGVGGKRCSMGSAPHGNASWQWGNSGEEVIRWLLVGLVGSWSTVARRQSSGWRKGIDSVVGGGTQR
jgi:hypothetical protein